MVRELKELGLGIRVDSGDLLCSLAYADDLVLLADSAEDLQTMVDKVSEWCRRRRLQINIKKTKVMVFGQTSGGERVAIRSGGATLEQVPEYKYLGILLNEDGRVGWRPAKEQMLRRARRAAAAAWGMIVCCGDMSARGMANLWVALVRPHLEYGVELISDEWAEAEQLQRNIARRVLRCGISVSNAALSGELGWMSLKGRRTMLRLSFWGKVLRMAPERWAKRAYVRSKEMLEQGGRVSGWCADTKRCLEQLGLQEWWTSQQVPDDWKELVREAVLRSEEQRWLEQVRGNGKLQLYRLVKQDFGRELYLQCPDVQRRRLWTKLRAGALELRVETGRWERVSVGGRQVPVPRYLRECEWCWAGVEDERHFLFRCASLESVRSTFWRAVPSHGNMHARVVEVIAKLRRDERLVDTEEDEIVLWMMSVDGLELSMSFAVNLWKRRKGLRAQLKID